MIFWTSLWNRTSTRIICFLKNVFCFKNCLFFARIMIFLQESWFFYKNHDFFTRIMFFTWKSFFSDRHFFISQSNKHHQFSYQNHTHMRMPKKCPCVPEWKFKDRWLVWMKHGKITNVKIKVCIVSVKPYQPKTQVLVLKWIWRRTAFLSVCV